jgi:hypothetical protein
MQFLQPPAPSLSGPNILNTLFSNTLSLCSSFHVGYGRLDNPTNCVCELLNLLYVYEIM